MPIAQIEKGKQVLRDDYPGSGEAKKYQIAEGSVRKYAG